MSKKILILTGDAAEALEVFYPYYRCLEEGYEVTIAAPNKKMLQTVVHDKQPEVMETSTERLAYRIQADASADEINPEEYDALIIPGGRAPEYIRTYPRVLEVVGHFLTNNKPVAAICHAALIFTTPELKAKLAGRSLTCVPTCSFDVQSAGMNFVKELVHQDGNLVSGQTWRDLPMFMKAFFQVLRAQ